jgi:UTP-glucose-1-phosphate uridylyltransferase
MLNCVVPIAGRGSRLQPITNSIPKFMMPLGTKPLIHYLADEMDHAGVDKVIFVVAEPENTEGGSAWFLNRYFQSSRSPGHFEDRGVFKPKNFEFNYEFVVQPQPDGLASAVFYGSRSLGTKFLVALPDEVWVNNFDTPTPYYHNPLNLLKESLSAGVVTRYVGTHAESCSYGVVQSISPVLLEEKPKVSRSLQVLCGRYQFEPHQLENIWAAKTEGELSLTPLLQELADLNKLKISVLPGRDLKDCGTLKFWQRAWSELQSA